MCVQVRDLLRLGHRCGQRLADHAVEDHIGRIAEDPWSDHGEGDPSRCQHCRKHYAGPLRPQSDDELFECLAQVLGLRGRCHGADPPPHRAAPAGAPRHHATASAPSCEATISRYCRHSEMSSSCLPMPTTWPSSRTMIRSAYMIVLTRWATMTTVDAVVSALSAPRSRLSVAASSAEKQSSKRYTAGRLTMARAMARR